MLFSCEESAKTFLGLELTLVLFATVYLTTNATMDFRCLVFIGIVFASVCSSQGGLSDLEKNGTVLPVAQPLKMACVSKDDCPENHFCEGRSIKRCTECIECHRFQRHPRKSYDGESCATHHTECGECIAEYEEIGGVCLPKTATTLSHATSFSDIFSREELAVEKNGDTKWANAPIWIVVFTIAMFAIMVLLFSVTKILLRKRSVLNNGHEEEGLTSNNGFCERSHPTAPLAPEEYRSPPTPYNPSFASDKLTASYGRRFIPLTNEQHCTALPYQPGNGASEWIITDDTEDNPDETDGGAPSNLPDPRQSTTVATHSANVQGNGVVQQTNAEMAAMDVSSNARQHVELPASIQQPRPSENDQSPPSQENLYGHIAMALRLQVGCWVRLSESSNPNPGANSSSSLLTSSASAPASPLRIDDTSAINLTELQEPFESNVSLDSGTGTNDRSVPSRSISGELSDMDDCSLFQ